MINLELIDIRGDSILIRVKEGKGRKERFTVLSEQMLQNLRAYFMQYKLKVYLIEAANGKEYSRSSIAKIAARAARKLKS